MAKNNLADKIENLPQTLKAIIVIAGKMAQDQGIGLYLVGGVVRDLILGRAIFDIDMVADQDAIWLADKLSKATGGKLTRHERFGTAKIQYPGFSFDITTTRTEEYHQPGALPTVKPGSVKDDLFRRDFTVNAMAINLTIDSYGELVDLYGGLDDLNKKLIRVLHERSFIDDATRIWRALRYQKRLDFQLETVTIVLLKHDINMLDVISGDRIRYELECVFGEQEPEKILLETAKLGVLQKLHSSLRFDQKMVITFRKAREACQSNPPSFSFYLALLANELSETEANNLSGYLHLPKQSAKILLDSIQLKGKLAKLEKANIKPSEIYQLLSDYAPAAIEARSVRASATSKKHIERYLANYRFVRPALNGGDLLDLGVKPGSDVKTTLARLRDARLDGVISDKQGEIELAKGWISNSRS